MAKKRNYKNYTEEDVRPEVWELYRYWQQVMGYPDRRLTAERVEKLEARLNAGFTVAQLREALHKASMDGWWRGINPRNTPYDDIVNIFRNDMRVEKFLTSGGSRTSRGLFAKTDEAPAPVKPTTTKNKPDEQISF